MRSLTITYFHTGIRTIIGVESFHGPVRDGKGWYQLAMVIRHKGGVVVGLRHHNQSGEEVVEFTLFGAPRYYWCCFGLCLLLAQH
jgi:hypothetical protein